LPIARIRESERALRIATYNLLHGLDLRSGRVDLDAVCQAILGLGVDIVAVQEVDRGLERTGGIDQVSRLAALLGWYGAFGPALLGDPDTRWSVCPVEERGGVCENPGGPAYGVGLLSRLPLTGIRRVLLPGGGDGARKPGASPQKPGWDYEPRVALSASVALDGTLVRITTTHLSYLSWRCVVQLKAAARFALAGRGPAVLLGDSTCLAGAPASSWQGRGGYTLAVPPPILRRNRRSRSTRSSSPVACAWRPSRSGRRRRAIIFRSSRRWCWAE
jgi:endonuclease/exonuclease/phosphatase family metal-dependent hydrolase